MTSNLNTFKLNFFKKIFYNIYFKLFFCLFFVYIISHIRVLFPSLIENIAIDTLKMESFDLFYNQYYLIFIIISLIFMFSFLIKNILLTYIKVSVEKNIFIIFINIILKKTNFKFNNSNKKYLQILELRENLTNFIKEFICIFECLIVGYGSFKKFIEKANYFSFIHFFIFLFFFTLIFQIFSIFATQTAIYAMNCKIKFFNFNLDILKNIFNIQIFSNCEYENQNMQKNLNKYIDSVIYRDYFHQYFYLFIHFIMNLFKFFILYKLMFSCFNNEIKITSVSTLFYLIYAFLDSVYHLNLNITYIYKSFKKISINFLKILLDFPDLIENKISEDILKNYNIEFKNIDFKYQCNKKYLFNNFSFYIKNFEKIGIKGPSGNGKTTLINLLLKFIEQNKGEVLIDGKNINNIKNYYNYFSIITQDLVLFNRSIKENISYSKLNATFDEIIFAAKCANIHNEINNKPEKYETMIKSNGLNLSFGQRQRILIARAFLKNAPILILDEPTSSLDAENEEKINKSLFSLMKNKTVICISHKNSLFKYMDRVIEIKAGKIV